MGHWFQRNPSWCTSYRIHCIAWILNFLRIPDSFREKTALKFWKPKKKQNRIRCVNDIECKDWQAGWRLCLFLGRPSGAVFSRIKLGLFFVLWVVSVNNFWYGNFQILNRLFIVNAGNGFKMLWKALGAFLDARTLAKIHVRILKTQLHFASQAARIKCLFQLQVLGYNYLSNLLEVIDQRCKSMQIFGIYINYCSESIVSFGYECFFHLLAPLKVFLFPLQ
jgi:hypothetical protein